MISYTNIKNQKADIFTKDLSHNFVKLRYSLGLKNLQTYKLLMSVNNIKKLITNKNYVTSKKEFFELVPL